MNMRQFQKTIYPSLTPWSSRLLTGGLVTFPVNVGKHGVADPVIPCLAAVAADDRAWIAPCILPVLLYSNPSTWTYLMIRQLFVSYVTTVLCTRDRFEGFELNRHVLESYPWSRTKHSLFRAPSEIQYVALAVRSGSSSR